MMELGRESVMGLRKSYWADMSPREINELVEKIFKELRTLGFPHFRLSRIERLKIVTQLSLFDPCSIIDGDVIRQVMLGQNLLNHHMPHIWSIKSHGFITPMDVFNCDQKLKVAIKKRLQLGDNISLAGIRKSLSWSRGAQKASSFRATVAKAVYNALGGGKVLDFSSGFGGRLLGAMSLKSVTTYTGIDPSTPSHVGLLEMISDYGWRGRANIIHGAFEDIDIGNGFDIAFSSPPYFNTEEYSNDPEQSYIRYASPREWRDGFLRPAIIKCYNSLKSGGWLAVNIANVDTYPDLEQHCMQDAGNCGFSLQKIMKIAFSKLMNKGFKYEPLFIFKK